MAQWHSNVHAFTYLNSRDQLVDMYKYTLTHYAHVCRYTCTLLQWLRVCRYTCTLLQWLRVCRYTCTLLQWLRVCRYTCTLLQWLRVLPGIIFTTIHLLFTWFTVERDISHIKIVIRAAPVAYSHLAVHRGLLGFSWCREKSVWCQAHTPST